MTLNELSAITPVDGRYRKQSEKLAPFFSEFGLIQYRIRIEVTYFIELCRLPLPQLSSFPADRYDDLRDLYRLFSISDALSIKEIEKTTNHDVKAVEYYIKEAFDRMGLEKYKEFIHFGLTSQDINNTAVPLSLKEGLTQVYLPVLNEITQQIELFASTWSDQPMLAHTHG
ncbi:MAG: adenylosuccinate lyase, partial [Bacteroidales bacterium]|nr:adenylosuccinate lyase [Bacteroidales bacterium]